MKISKRLRAQAAFVLDVMASTPRLSNWPHYACDDCGVLWRVRALVVSARWSVADDPPRAPDEDARHCAQARCAEAAQRLREGWEP